MPRPRFEPPSSRSNTDALDHRATVPCKCVLIYCFTHSNNPCIQSLLVTTLIINLNFKYILFHHLLESNQRTKHAPANKKNLFWKRHQMAFFHTTIYKSNSYICIVDPNSNGHVIHQIFSASMFWCSLMEMWALDVCMHARGNANLIDLSSHLSLRDQDCN